MHINGMNTFPVENGVSEAELLKQTLSSRVDSLHKGQNSSIEYMNQKYEYNHARNKIGKLILKQLIHYLLITNL